MLLGRIFCVGLVTPAECGVSECDLETSTMKMPWPTRAVKRREKQGVRDFYRPVALRVMLCVVLTVNTQNILYRGICIFSVQKLAKFTNYLTNTVSSFGLNLRVAL